MDCMTRSVILTLLTLSLLEPDFASCANFFDLLLIIALIYFY
jgi:hypothetical protein